MIDRALYARFRDSRQARVSFSRGQRGGMLRVGPVRVGWRRSSDYGGRYTIEVTW